jgi:hypothetical protein
MKRLLKQTVEIRDASSDSKVKLQANSIAENIYKDIMELMTNGTIVTDAFNRITQIQKDVTVLNRLDESMKVDEAEMNTSGVF